MKSEFEIFQETVVPELYKESFEAVYKLKSKAWENGVYLESNFYPFLQKNSMQLKGGGYMWIVKSAEDIKKEAQLFSKGNSVYNTRTAFYDDEGERKGEKASPVDEIEDDEWFKTLQKLKGSSGASSALAPFLGFLKIFADEFYGFCIPQESCCFFFIIIGDIGFTTANILNLRY